MFGLPYRNCPESGRPDVETVVATLRAGEMLSIGTVHKPIPNVTADELKTAFELASFLSRTAVEP